MLFSLFSLYKVSTANPSFRPRLIGRTLRRDVAFPENIEIGYPVDHLSSVLPILDIFSAPEPVIIPKHFGRYVGRVVKSDLLRPILSSPDAGTREIVSRCEIPFTWNRIRLRFIVVHRIATPEADFVGGGLSIVRDSYREVSRKNRVRLNSSLHIIKGKLSGLCCFSIFDLPLRQLDAAIHRAPLPISDCSINGSRDESEPVPTAITHCTRSCRCCWASSFRWGLFAREFPRQP